MGPLNGILWFLWEWIRVNSYRVDPLLANLYLPIPCIGSLTLRLMIRCWISFIPLVQRLNVGWYRIRFFNFKIWKENFDIPFAMLIVYGKRVSEINGFAINGNIWMKIFDRISKCVISTVVEVSRKKWWKIKNSEKMVRSRLIKLF